MRLNPFTAHQMFKERFGGLGTRRANFLTPSVVSRGKLNPDVAYEISTGLGLTGDRGQHPQPIWGLTVIAWDARSNSVVSCPVKSTMFHSLAEARSRVGALKLLLKTAPGAWADWTAEYVAWCAEQPKGGRGTVWP